MPKSDLLQLQFLLRDNPGTHYTNNSQSGYNQVHQIRDRIKENVINIVHTTTDEQLADFLTKTPARPQFERNRSATIIVSPASDKSQQNNLTENKLGQDMEK